MTAHMLFCSQVAFHLGNMCSLVLLFGCSKIFKYIYWHVCVNHIALKIASSLLSYSSGICKYLLNKHNKNISQTHSEVIIFINFQVHICIMQNFHNRFHLSLVIVHRISTEKKLSQKKFFSIALC